MDTPLITKYRPQSFDELVGHEEVVAALRRSLASGSRPHSYLLTGPSGTGKTTIARILAADLGAEIVEIDAASHSGVDAMREIVELASYASLAGAGLRMIIIDECHALSRASWQATLKLLEEPPAHLYLALCTTELNKVPETVVTRCYHAALRPLRTPELEDLLLAVCALENWEVAPDILQTVIAVANGSPRRALSTLQAVHGVTSKEELRRIVTLMETGEPVIELGRLLTKDVKEWAHYRSALQRLDAEDDYEAAANGLSRYLITALLSTEAEATAQRLWRCIDALLFPTASFDRKAAFFAAIGRVLWG